ncbi:MAG: hypothetical protein ACXVDE_02310 [Tumebacillaceae bacterium]
MSAERFDRIENMLVNLTNTVAILVEQQAETNRRLDRIETRLDAVEQRLDAVEQRLDFVEQGLRELNGQYEELDQRVKVK